jgi:hypothetical protein
VWARMGPFNSFGSNCMLYTRAVWKNQFDSLKACLWQDVNIHLWPGLRIRNYYFGSGCDFRVNYGSRSDFQIIWDPDATLNIFLDPDPYWILFRSTYVFIWKKIHILQSFSSSIVNSLKFRLSIVLFEWQKVWYTILVLIFTRLKSKE